ncbi:heme-copper oxidase subunit III [Burkholderia territorii]|uniref:cytochrome c oxidase subunit 3 n=1 Tax=Burkholderia territorii TaxID=1503055 RepID=UPI00075770BF|nr:cytochrome c oxidase subunit 3 [Burkholderia territorii]KVL04999.1 cytochrome C oxidase subunit III [Burkholderia territorii]
MSDARAHGSSPDTLDVSALSTYAHGPRSVTWWATGGLMLIEGTVFAIALMTYFYVRSLAGHWPLGAPPPAAWAGTLNTVLMLASLLPNFAAQRAAQRSDLVGARTWLAVCAACAWGFIVVRAFEFGTLNVDWYTNAYGSVVWLLVGLHTTHLITDAIDTSVLATLLFVGPFEGKRFGNVGENALYWYFVVLSWLPIYATVYLVPRL